MGYLGGDILEAPSILLLWGHVCKSLGESAHG